MHESSGKIIKYDDTGRISVRFSEPIRCGDCPEVSFSISEYAPSCLVVRESGSHIDIEGTGARLRTRTLLATLSEGPFHLNTNPVTLDTYIVAENSRADLFAQLSALLLRRIGSSS